MSARREGLGMARVLALLPMLVAVAALGAASADWRLAAVLGSLVLGIALLGPRFQVDRGRRLLTAAIGAGAGYALVDVLYVAHKGSLGDAWARFSAAALLAAAARLLLVGIEGRMVTTALVFAGLLASGETQVAGYPGLVALFLVCGVWAPVVHEEHRLASGAPARRIALGLAIVLAGGAVAAAMTFAAKRGYRWMISGERSLALNWTPQSGFSDAIDLGALDELLDSDTVVLRIRGPRVDYLRGAVLDFYAGGRWVQSDAAHAETLAIYDAALPETEAVKIAAVSERTGRFFLPLAMRSVSTSPSPVRVDATGAIKRSGDHGLEAARFVVGPRDRAVPLAPDASDLQVPRTVGARLHDLAAEWAAGATTPEAKLDALERRLRQEFRYARFVPPFGGPDPILDFLFVHKSGHCEYFATSLVLLARASGIPARFVAGYRVGERTPFGYYVVRERNAHAWVEAWVPGLGWTTRDATPESYLPQNLEHRSGYFASLFDGLRVAYDAFDDWLGRRTLEQTAAAWMVGFAVLVWIVARGVRRSASESLATADDVGLPCLGVLLSALGRSGVVHDGREPIELLACRTPDPDAARLLERYAALRYGGLGDPASLAEDVTTYAQQSDRATRPTRAV